MSDSMTFLINDATTDGGPDVWATVTEQEDGTLLFTVSQDGDLIGDLRGLLFDVSDESLIGSLSVTALSDGLTEVQSGDDTVYNLGNGSNMNGLLGSGLDEDGYDIGIEIGTAGIGEDDYRTFSFVLSSADGNLTLADLSNIDFGVRLTSVGTEDGAREESAKLLEITSSAIDAQDDIVTVEENNTIAGDVLANDMDGLSVSDVVSVIDFSGGGLGETIVLDGAEGATFELYADGSYLVDASTADALSEGEVLTYSFDYTVQALHEETSWSQSDGILTISIYGVNDGPVAEDDFAGTIAEDGSVAGNLLNNDYDTDRLDEIHVASVNGQLLGEDGTITLMLDSGAVVTVNADGTYTYDTNGAFEILNDGDLAADGFSYTIADNHGAEDTALVYVDIQGVGGDDPELSLYGLSHGYWKNHDNDWNIDHDTSFEEFFGVDLDWSVGGGRNALEIDDILFTDGLALGGGDQNALAREAITAVLNALDEKNGTEYQFAYTVEEVVDMVYTAYTSGESSQMELTKNLLEATHI